MLATEHTLLRTFLNIWREILFPGDLQMMLLRILVQLSVELKLRTRSAPHSTLKQLPVYFHLIIVLIQFDCFDKSVSRKAILFVLTVVYEQCYDE